MNILVTGGAGFIGSNFCYYILEKYPDYNVICLDKLTYAGNLSTLEKARADKRFLFVQGDIADQDFVTSLFQQHKIHKCVNFAAESHVDRSFDDTRVFLMTNVIGTQVLMDACRSNGNIRFHQVSTDEVYGDLALDQPDALFEESMPLRPSTPYSSSKASADLLALAYLRTFGLPVTISRCGNNYGPFQFPEKLIPRLILRAKKGLDLPIHGEGKHIRDWLYVEDNCAAIDLILHKGRIGEVYNVGVSKEKTSLEIAKQITARLGVSAPKITFVPDRKGNDLRYGIDASKIRSELGWQASTGFDEGLDKTVEWYLTNETWWTDIIDRGYRQIYD